MFSYILKLKTHLYEFIYTEYMYTHNYTYEHKWDFQKAVQWATI